MAASYTPIFWGIGMGGIALSGLAFYFSPPSPPPSAPLDWRSLDRHLSAFPRPSSGPLAFPRDHGRHGDQRGERWAFTLGGSTPSTPSAPTKAPWIGQWSFTVGQLAPPTAAADTPPALAATALWLAQRWITPPNGSAQTHQRLSRDAAELAGTAPLPDHDAAGAYRGWVEDLSWQYDGHQWRLIGVDEALTWTPAGPPMPFPADSADADNVLVRGYWQAFGVTGQWQGQEIAGHGLLEHLWGRLPLGTGQQRTHRLVMRTDDGHWWQVMHQSRRPTTGRPSGPASLSGGRLQNSWLPLTALTLQWGSVAGDLPLPRDLAADGVGLRLTPRGAVLGLLDHHGVGLTLDGTVDGVAVRGWAVGEWRGYDAPAPVDGGRY